MMDYLKILNEDKESMKEMYTDYDAACERAENMFRSLEKKYGKSIAYDAFKNIVSTEK